MVFTASKNYEKFYRQVLALLTFIGLTATAQGAKRTAEREHGREVVLWDYERAQRIVDPTLELGFRSTGVKGSSSRGFSRSSDCAFDWSGSDSTFDKD